MNTPFAVEGRKEMAQMFRTKPRMGDLLATLTVVILALALLWIPMLSRETGSVLEITTPQGSTEYSLLQNQRLTVESNGIRLEIVIENGEAYVAHSECPDGVCVAGGRISKSGQSLLCAPAGIRLYVKGGDADVDFVAG